jgi:ATP adenylyltransferase
MNKSDLVQKLMKKESLSEKQAARIVNMIFDAISEESEIIVLKEEKGRQSEDDFNFRCMIDQCFNHECIFCAASDEHFLMENDYAYALPDKYPITEGHTLIIPKRHFAYYFDSIKVEHDAIYDLLKSRGKQLVDSDSAIEGFDIGVNVGEIAGQKVFHCHIHLIPRRRGDSPKWGIRSKSQ